MGKFINDDCKQSNYRPKVFEKKDGRPTTVVVATRQIKEHQKLRYIYGKGSYPWRKNVIVTIDFDNKQEYVIGDR